MGLLDFFKRKPKPTADEEFHEYVADLRDLNKLRDSTFQKSMLVKADTPAYDKVMAEMQRYSTMIECAQKAIIEIKEREARKAAAAQK